MKRVLIGLLACFCGAQAGAVNLTLPPYPFGFPNPTPVQNPDGTWDANAYPSTSTDYNITLPVTLFDTKFGALTQVGFSLTGHIESDAQVYNKPLGEALLSQSFWVAATMTLQRPDTSSLVVVLPKTTATVDVPTITDPTYHPTATGATAYYRYACTAARGCVDSGYISTNATSTMTSSTLADRLLFTKVASATLDLPVSAVADSSWQGSSNVWTSFTSAAFPEGSVTYTYTPSTIQGKVYLDLGASGTPALPGETVTLTSADGQCQTVDAGGNPTGTWVAATGNNCQAHTDASGNYIFYVTNGSTYTLTETQPAAWKDGTTYPGKNASNVTVGSTSTPNIITGIAVALTAGGAAQDYTQYNFSETAASISGFVYMDTGVGGGGPDNGQMDGTEPGIAGVPVALSTTDNATCYKVGTGFVTPCSLTMSGGTLGSGAYSFTALGAGTYTVTETQPTGVLDGKTTAGTGWTTTQGASPGGKPFVNPQADTITNIGVGAGGTLVNYNFGELPTATSTLSGKVYLQTTGNPGINGVPVKLVCTAGACLAGPYPPGCSNWTACTQNTSTIGGVVGSYSFTGLTSGTYTVIESQPPDYGEGTITAPSGNTSFVPGASGSSTIDTIGVTAGTNYPGYNFGETVGLISGRVCLGADGTADCKKGEAGIAGVTLTLTGTAADGTTAVSMTSAPTGTDGSYSFTGLSRANAAGYKIAEQLQTDAPLNSYQDGPVVLGTSCGTCGTTTSSPNSINAIPFDPDTVAGYTNYNFVELPLSGASISGKVYHDVGGTAAYEPASGDTPLGNVTITLSLEGGGACGLSSCTTTTAANGTYSFTGLTPGTAYRLTETQPTGMSDFGTSGSFAGTAGSPATTKGSTLDAAPNVITAITLASGDDGINYDFREAASSLSGRVFLDDGRGSGVLNNGTQDGTEPGLSTVKVTLNASDGGKCADGLSTTCFVNTDASGNFSFAGLPTGTYALVETQPSYNDGKETAGTSGGRVDNTAFDATPAHNTIDQISLAAATQASGYLFAELPTPTAAVSGRAWINKIAGLTTYSASTGIPLQNWVVKVLDGSNGLMGQATTGTDGTYSIPVPPGIPYHVQFTNPATGQVWPGVVNNAGAACGSGCQVSEDKKAITNVAPGAGTANNVIPGLDLPIDPSGVIYDSRTGAPIPNAVVTISGAGPTQTYTTLNDGVYQFFFASTAPAGSYQISVVAPGYLPVSVATPSAVVLPCAQALNVSAGDSTHPDPGKIQNAGWTPARLTDPAIGRQTSCPSDNTTASGFVLGQATTLYYLGFNVVNSWANLFNNHIPMDKVVGDNILMTKTTPLMNVARGDLVPYTITASNRQTYPLSAVTIEDFMPPGFKYKTGSATMDGVPMEPVANGRTLSWSPVSFVANNTAGTLSSALHTFRMLLVVGTGVGDGIYNNCTQAMQGGASVSNRPCAPVRVVPDPTFDCPDVIGKVFDDKNANGYQDQGEPGIPNVRMATPRGLLVTSDAEGRFHVPCPEIPNPDRGSNFFMKLDDRTLPSGYRLTTENPRDVRLTRGKLVKLNFGATIHRVVRIELTDAAFVAGKEDLLPEWQKKIEALPRQLTDKPSLIRLAYPPGADPELTKKRIDALKKQIEKRWQDLDCCYRLVIETEGEQ